MIAKLITACGASQFIEVPGNRPKPEIIMPLMTPARGVFELKDDPTTEYQRDRVFKFYDLERGLNGRVCVYREELE